MTPDTAFSAWRFLLARLHHTTNSQRVTLRLDYAPQGWQVDAVLIEILEPGVPTLLHEVALPQRKLATVQYLQREQRTLIQDNVETAAIKPPAALTAQYQVRSQMLGPILVHGSVAGWVSVHNTKAPHAWTSLEQQHLQQAVRTIQSDFLTFCCG
ncbi:MAG: GAF domain-containing protein [Thermaerobacter sp.]|nr:GAF domain-containing protein [Thermaerobacter sp.]